MKRTLLRGLAATATLATLASACVPKTRTGATAATVAGTAVAIVGTAMLVELNSPGDDTDGNGVDDFNENEFACILGGCLIAGTMVAVGAAIAIAGIVGLKQTSEQPPPGHDVANPLATNSEPTPAIDARIAAPLPELPADAETLRLAQQARAAARHGHCDAALVTAERIRRHHPRYAYALVHGPVLARCRTSY